MDTQILSESVEQTIALGRRFGKRLRGGETVAVCGQLGSGKTHFIKGVAAGVCGDQAQQQAHSPTFVLVNEYRGRLDVYHIDAYRLESCRQLESIGFDDYFFPESVVVIEWADKVTEALEGMDCISIRIFHESENSRRITMRNLPNYLIE